MKLDQLVLKRFDELSQKAKEIGSAIKQTGLTIVATNAPVYYVDEGKFYEWATSVLNLLQRAFGIESVHYVSFDKHLNNFRGRLTEFERCRAIFIAAKEDYEGGYLFNLKSLVSAEVIDDILGQGEELLRAGYKDAACVVAGVTLETALKRLCTNQGMAHGKLDKMNADLCKAGLYNVGMQKQITAWADRRNKAAHGEWDQYTAADVEDMIRGANRFIAEYL